MAEVIFGMQQSLDGYVDHEMLGPPGPAAARHFLEHARSLAGAVYGRRMYEVMCYWDDDQPEWDESDHEFAAICASCQSGDIALIALGRPQRHTHLQ